MLKYLLPIVFLLSAGIASARWIDDIVLFANEDAGNVAFSHYQHLEILGKNCVLCHNRVFNIDRSKNQPATMEQMAAGQSCGACHNGSKAFSVEENCETCHEM